MLGLSVHAGHGLTYANVTPVAALPLIEEVKHRALHSGSRSHRGSDRCSAGDAAPRAGGALAGSGARALDPSDWILNW